MWTVRRITHYPEVLPTLAKHLDLVEKHLSGSTEFLFFFWLFWYRADPDSVKTCRGEKTHTQKKQQQEKNKQNDLMLG